MDITLRAARAQDIDWLVELRARVLRADLERLGRFDEGRVRERLRRGYRPEWTRIIVVDGADAGSITVRPDGEERWLEHFYLEPSRQGRGIGRDVLRGVLAEEAGRRIRLNVLQGSRARRLYEREGFVLDGEDDVDVFLSRTSS